MKLDLGGDGVSTPVSGTVPVSGSITASGSVTVTQGTGTNLHAVLDSGTLTAITNVVHVDDNAGSLTVDNAGTFAVQDSEKVVDRGTFTQGTTKVQPAGFIFDEVIGTALTENMPAAARINANRSQVGVLEDGATRAQYLSISAAGAAKVDGSAVTQPVSGTVTANAGTGNFTVVNGGTFSVQDTQVVTDNAAFTDGTTKVLAAGFVFDEVAGTALTENDAAAARIDSKRAQVGVLEDATTRGQRAAVSAAGRLSVDGSGVTQPVSGTVTANIGTSGSLALDASVTGLQVAQGSTTSGQKGGLALGAVTTGNPTYTTAQTSPLSLDTAGALRVHIAASDVSSSGGTSMADDAAFTVGTSSVTPAGGTYRSVRDLVDDNDVGALAMTQRRALLVSMEDSTGDSAMDDANNALRVNVVAGSSGGPSKTDDAAFTVATDAVSPAGYMADEVSPDSVDEGDVGVARMSLNRNVYTQIRDGSAERSAAVTAANAVKVDGSAVTQPVSGTVTTTPPANASTNIAQVAGTTTDVNTGNAGAGTLRVVLATDQPQLSNSFRVVGNVNSGSADSGSPAKVGGKYNLTPPTFTDGQRADLQMNANGSVRVDGSATTQPVSGTVTANAGTGTFGVGGAAAQDAAITGNPVQVGGRASSAIPTAMSADGDVVYPWLDRSGGTVVNGRDAHDAALDSNTNPQLVGGRASAAAPADVSADGDAVRAWFLRSGAQATVVTAAGALIGGDAANGLDVDVTRLPALVAGSANIGKVDINTEPTAGGKTPAFASVSVASSGANQIVAADATRKIKVVSYVLVADAAVTAKWQSAANDKSGAMSLAANGGVSAIGSFDSHILETAVNEALNLNLGSAIGVRGHISYFLET